MDLAFAIASTLVPRLVLFDCPLHSLANGCRAAAAAGSCYLSPRILKHFQDPFVGDKDDENENALETVEKDEGKEGYGADDIDSI